MNEKLTPKESEQSGELLKKEIIEAIKKHQEISPDVISSVETMIESISDKNQFHDLDEVKVWFKKKVDECPMAVEEIGLKDVKGGWHYNEKGNLVHESGGFFSVIGVKVSNAQFRESGKGWEQPMVDQGTKSSINATLRKRFNGVYHYLVQAKAEPGNYGKVQVSPTLQVTFSNFNQMHKGNKPLFSDLYDDPEKYKVVYAHWLPEDGGRFYLKRIYSMLVEADENTEIQVPEGFIWLTMYQIKQLLKEDNIVNPHIRSIIAHL
ncbi:MAG: NDP-hexose 2,3-dehydratase family protein [Candidatus Aenigmarchaeota archaeon]|nr:NDP-hexose 2,3-dehydratase family protein [Candidatus Aenigmarchaeota archaeon]